MSKVSKSPNVSLTSAARKALQRRALRERGLCTMCGKCPPRPGQARCQNCTKRANEFNRNCNARKRANGLCVTCGKPHPSNGKCQCLAESYQVLRLAAMLAIGGPVCACCGETELRFLTLDHINGGGNIERRTSIPSSALYRRLRDRGYPPGFQVLCFNCNSGRHFNGGVCPHKATLSGEDRDRMSILHQKAAALHAVHSQKGRTA